MSTPDLAVVEAKLNAAYEKFGMLWQQPRRDINWARQRLSNETLSYAEITRLHDEVRDSVLKLQGYTAGIASVLRIVGFTGFETCDAANRLRSFASLIDREIAEAAPVVAALASQITTWSPAAPRAAAAASTLTSTSPPTQPVTPASPAPVPSSSDPEPTPAWLRVTDRTVPWTRAPRQPGVTTTTTTTTTSSANTGQGQPNMSDEEPEDGNDQNPPG
ncbi:MAG TPA: hypothetical protein VG708_14875 [Mycobacteriales bacterium]|nr:hypothetical protein [Mycobacteriales bacterium]